jgi:hypothetical protein
MVMNTFVHIEQPLQHAGVVRAENFGAFIASIKQRIAAWNSARKQAAQDQQLWDIALTDARVMADLSRAMTSDAQRDVRGYY